jgi:REP element-mobilizing transposase RayT
MKQLELTLRTWGGRRRGAGRPPKAGRRSVPHRRRAPHVARCPAHVTFRAVSKLPSLRDEPTFVAIRRALGQATKAGFRVFEFSVQTDHLHLLVEANDPTQFERGMRGLTIRIAKTVNRVLGRAGRVWGDRFHARLIRPRERCGTRSSMCCRTGGNTCPLRVDWMRNHRPQGFRDGGRRWTSGAGPR